MLQKIKKNPLTVLLFLGFIGLAAYVFWPKPKPHKFVRTFCLWFVNPAAGKDTGTIVVRVDYDTLYPYKKLDSSRYYVPLAQNDTLKRTAPLKDTIVTNRYWRLWDPAFIIHDFDKKY